MTRGKAFGLTLLLGPAFLMTALGSAPPQKPGHVFRADTTDFRLEDGIPVFFTNGADEPVGAVLHCFTWLQGRDDPDWVDLFTPDCSHMRVFPRQVQPGETIEDVFPLDGIDPDTLRGWSALRLRSSLHRPDQPEEEILSEPFVLPLD